MHPLQAGMQDGIMVQSLIELVVQTEMQTGEKQALQDGMPPVQAGMQAVQAEIQAVQAGMQAVQAV